MSEFEVCLDSNDLATLARDVSKSYSAGAHRIELCSDLSAGGLTPTADAIEVARNAFKTRKGLMVMIRPRAGDFVYSTESLIKMAEQVAVAEKLGANGVVFGGLDKEHNIDTKALGHLMPICRFLGLSVTFHRAFDQVCDRSEALETLIEFGVDKVLTSGTAWQSNSGALDGIDVIRGLIKQAENRIEIVIGGGVCTSNIGAINRHLPYHAKRVSFHSNSGVLRDGEVSSTLVKKMLHCIEH